MMGRFLRATVLSLVAVALPTAATGQTCNTSDRMIALVLDASGSMNAVLPDGETRIEVARRAIGDVARAVPGEAVLSLRLYGAQSPRVEKNCQDTNLAVPFGKASATAAEIVAQVDAAKAQGWTPIALALQQVVGDFPAETGEKVVVLVSDGKETCAGDPCIAAKALSDAGITLHTVGFVVDSAARMQLQCAAKATGGSYFDAPVGPELPQALIAALSACKMKLVLPTKPKPGTLRTSSAGSNVLHVRNAETHEEVGSFDAANMMLKLPAGIYEVTFGPAIWKGIEVRSGEETLIEPGVLRLEHAGACSSCEVIDSETGDSFGALNAGGNEVVVPPGVYDIRFGPVYWRYIRVDGGAATTMSPALIKGAPGGALVKDAQGIVVVRFDAVYHNTALPPGDYLLVVEEQEYPLSLSAGQTLEVQ